MAFRTFRTSQSVMSLDDFGRDLARRREALGTEIFMPRNNGARRTASKTILLAEIEAKGGRW